MIRGGREQLPMPAPEHTPSLSLSLDRNQATTSSKRLSIIVHSLLLLLLFHSFLQVDNNICNNMYSILAISSVSDRYLR